MLAQIASLYGALGNNGLMAYHLAPDHVTRLDALEQVLETAYHDLIENRHVFHKQSEDELSINIVGKLKSAGIEASHDTQTGGHCDIHVRGADHFLWIGEAKVHSTYKWLEDGFHQLSTRYATGAYGQDSGELLIYCTGARGVDVLETWRDKLVELYPEVAVVEDKIRERLWFRTTHTGVSTGLPFNTRHRLLPLHFAPLK
ncbi:hypothetical protein [Paracoccus sp. (in: a-proteobacteria)]|uniref:hypothetical protein n=1 Tax=Paracoccus sp. TaxID=267 RepID=UPI0028A6D257|nr:hypothetical protein [Paracoccus sp. (in: a-proteobacteria)]